MAVPSTRHSSPDFRIAVTQYINAICRSKPTVANDKKRIDNRGGTAFSARSTDQYAPSGKNMPQKSNTRNKVSALLSIKGLRHWIEINITHTTTVIERVR